MCEHVYVRMDWGRVGGHGEMAESSWEIFFHLACRDLDVNVFINRCCRNFLGRGGGHPEPFFFFNYAF